MKVAACDLAIHLQNRKNAGSATFIGYDKAAQAAHKAFEENISLKEACLKLQLLSEEEFARLVDPAKMIHPKLNTL